MIDINNLFAGAENYMESLDDTNNAPDNGNVIEQPQVVETVSSEVEQTFDGSDISNEADKIDNAIDTISELSNEVDRMIMHVQRFGVDRSFLSLMNYDNRLSRAFNVSFPACENFNAVGSPYSAESIAALEGFSDVVKKIWEFIKSIFQKIVDFISKLFNFNSNDFKRTDEQLDACSKSLHEQEKLLLGYENTTSSNSSSNALLTLLKNEGVQVNVDLNKLDEVSRAIADAFNKIGNIHQSVFKATEDGIMLLDQAASANSVESFNQAITTLAKTNDETKSCQEIYNTLDHYIRSTFFKSITVNNANELINTGKKSYESLKRFVNENKKYHEKCMSLKKGADHISAKLEAGERVIKKLQSVPATRSAEDTLRTELLHGARDLLVKLRSSSNDCAKTTVILMNVIKLSISVRHKALRSLIKLSNAGKSKSSNSKPDKKYQVVAV